MSFMIPKKPQILYSPMLATFGGGSARGFNPGGGVGTLEDIQSTTGGYIATGSDSTRFLVVLRSVSSGFSNLRLPDLGSDLRVVLTGGGSAGNSHGGGGGGAGTASNDYTPAQYANKTCSVVLGAGGAYNESTSDGTSGPAGNTSTFDLSGFSIITANGGGNPGSGNSGAGGLGGSTSNGGSNSASGGAGGQGGGGSNVAGTGSSFGSTGGVGGPGNSPSGGGGAGWCGAGGGYGTGQGGAGYQFYGGGRGYQRGDPDFGAGGGGIVADGGKTRDSSGSLIDYAGQSYPQRTGGAGGGGGGGYPGNIYGGGGPGVIIFHQL